MTDPQEPSRPLRVVSLALAMFIVATALVWLSRENGPPPYVPDDKPPARERAPEPPAPDGPDEPTEPPPPSAATVRAEALDALPALPPADAPLSEQIAVLESRALAGDPVAGCRLLSAVARCAATDAGGFCTQLQTRDLPGADRVLEATQAWMSPRQKVLAALLRADGTIARLGSPAPAPSDETVYPQFLADRAYDFLLEGFRAGEPLALEGLALVHAPSGAPALAIALPNPRLFVFHTGVLEQVFGSAALGDDTRRRRLAARGVLTPAVREEVDGLIAAEAARWHEIAPPEELSQRWQRLRRDDVRRDECAP